MTVHTGIMQMIIINVKIDFHKCLTMNQSQKDVTRTKQKAARLLFDLTNKSASKQKQCTSKTYECDYTIVFSAKQLLNEYKLWFIRFGLVLFCGLLDCPIQRRNSCRNWTMLNPLNPLCFDYFFHFHLKSMALPEAVMEVFQSIWYY